ncbi:hypothetical protein J45TS6_03520 [Paenibacillus sp. J45TS6]|nr:hypothetical protein J45TS6_03520 [Paenibacillus sp. J45TS6]
MQYVFIYRSITKAEHTGEIPSMLGFMFFIDESYGLTLTAAEGADSPASLTAVTRKAPVASALLYLKEV